MRFLVRFLSHFQRKFCRSRIHDENRKRKLVAISMRFAAAISQRFPEHVRNYMQVGGDLVKKTEVNMAHKQGPNCIGITASLHLQTKVAFQQKSHV